jgi:hypothetical protein
MSRNKIIADIASRALPPIALKLAKWAQRNDQSAPLDIADDFAVMMARISAEFPGGSEITIQEINQIISPLLLTQTNALLGYIPRERTVN